MIERFNFYDIYGYLLPGTLLTALLWLPFGLATGGLPSKEISSTLLLLAVAYIAGHVLQSLAAVVVSSDAPDDKGVLRAPSSILLDAGCAKFSKSVKDGIAARIKALLGLEILGAGEDVLADRDVAFLEARAYLVRNKASSYLEQFEGLYAMTRGLGAAFFVGTAYLLGWCLGFHWQMQFLGLSVWVLFVGGSAASLLLTGALVGRQKSRKAEATGDRWLAVCLMLVILGFGYFLGTWRPLAARLEFFLWALLPLMIVAGSRCLLAYRSYSQYFAETVWRDFYGLYPKDGAGTNMGSKDPEE